MRFGGNLPPAAAPPKMALALLAAAAAGRLPTRAAPHHALPLGAPFRPPHAPLALRAPPHRAPRAAVTMVFDRFDRDAMRLVMDAQVEARKLGGTVVGTEHLLLASTMQSDSIQSSLERIGVVTKGVRDSLRGPGASSIPSLDGLFGAKSRGELLPFAKDTERCFKTTLQRSSENDYELVSAKDLVTTLLSDDAPDSGASKLLLAMGIDRKEVLKEVEMGERELVGAGGQGRGKNSTLARCSIDLTQKAREGRLDPMVGREDEVRRCMQILVRRRKNNPVLIGDPGVGKTAIVEGIAQAIVEDRVPPKLRGKRVVSLEMGLLLADTKYRGEFEQRLKEVVEEVTSSNDTVL